MFIRYPEESEDDLQKQLEDLQIKNYSGQTQEIKIPEKEIIKWRRHIHEYPELSFREFETARYVMDLLKSFGNIEVIQPTKTSVLAVIRGSRPGKTVAFVADIDALPITEETGLPFTSKNPGVMHACGHDGMTAMLLGTAKVLSGMRDQINGTVKLVFQHAEEQLPGGAREVLATGLLNDVDALFVLHIIPERKTGLISIAKGVATASVDGLYLRIKGKGGHASFPQDAIDPILIGSEIVMALNTIVSRNVPPGELAVVSPGQFNAGEAINIIPDTANLSVSIRSVSKEVRTLLEKRSKEIIEYITKANNATYDLNYEKGYSAIMNDPELVNLALKAIAKANGQDMVSIGDTITASDDFSRYTDVKKGCFMILGGGLAKDGYKYMNHNPRFVFDEDALVYGTRAEIQIILDYLDQ